MIISETLLNELDMLKTQIELLSDNSEKITNTQLEIFLRNLEKRRYNVLNEIKLYNDTVELKTERINNISDEYKASVEEDILKLYIPEPMPSYKNLKTHAYKNILLNLIEITKPYKDMFGNEEVFIYIKVFDNIKGWDIDNKFIKAIPDSLILSGVIQDDNIDKMFYCAKGEFSTEPHTEVYVTKGKNSIKIM